MNTTSRIRQLLPGLKTAESKVAEFILKDPSLVPELTITELAEKTGVSEPTVVRFCQKIGLKGYMELKLNLASELPAPAYVHDTIGDGDAPLQVLEKLFDANQEAFRNGKNLTGTRDFETAVEWLSQANRIEFYGFGGSGCVATDAQYRFFRLGVACNAYRDVHMQFESASLLDENSVVVAISTNGSTRNIIEAARIAKEAGARVIGLIGRDKSPLHQFCDIAFSLVCQEPAPVIQRFTTRLVQLALLDALFVSCLQSNSKIKDNLKKIRQSLAGVNF